MSWKKLWAARCLILRIYRYTTYANTPNIAIGYLMLSCHYARYTDSAPDYLAFCSAANAPQQMLRSKCKIDLSLGDWLRTLHWIGYIHVRRRMRCSSKGWSNSSYFCRCCPLKISCGNIREFGIFIRNWFGSIFWYSNKHHYFLGHVVFRSIFTLTLWGRFSPAGFRQNGVNHIPSTT
jgi:hypothetical protein